MGFEKQYSCGNKVDYLTYPEAKRVMVWIVRSRRITGLVIYRCRYCPCWHIGHQALYKVKKARKE